MARTARNLITEAAINADVIDALGDLEALEASHILDTLNSIVESFALDKLFTQKNVTSTVNTTATAGIITIGPTAPVDIVTQRPNRIISVAIVSDGEYVPLEFISPDDFVLKIKSLNATGDPAYYTISDTYPNLTIELYPSTTPADTRVTYQYLKTGYTLNDTIDLPDGYYPALEAELSKELAILYHNMDKVPYLEKRAMDRIARVKRLHNKGRNMTIRGAVGVGGGSYDIYTDSYR